MKNTYLESNELSGYIDNVAESHGLKISMAYDNSRGVSNEGLVKSSFGDIVRPVSDYADYMIANTVIVGIDVCKGANKEQLDAIIANIETSLVEKNIPSKYYSLVHERKTSNGIRYSLVKADEQIKDGAISHYIYGIPTDYYTNNPTAEHHDNLTDVQERFDFDIKLYSNWLNNEVLEITVEPISKVGDNLFCNHERGSWSYKAGNIQSIGDNNALNGEPDRLAIRVMEDALHTAGRLMKFSFKTTLNTPSDEFSVLPLLREVSNSFGFYPVVNDFKIVVNGEHNIITLEILETSIPSLPTLVNGYLLNASYDEDGFLHHDFLEEVLLGVERQVKKDGLSDTDVLKNKLEISSFINEMLLHDQMLTIHQGKYNNYYKKDAIDIPYILKMAVLFSVFELSSPDTVLELVL